MSKKSYAFKLGDTVRVNPTLTTSRTNGRPWPASVVGYVDGYSRSDDESDSAMYVLYGDRDTPQWGIQFAEADLELVETVEQRLGAKTVVKIPDNVRWQANWPSEFEARHIEFDLETGRLLGVHKPANTPERAETESDDALVEWHKLTPAQQAAIIAVATTNSYFEHQSAIDELFRARHIKYDRLWGAYELSLTGRGMYEAYRRSIKQDDQS